MEKQKKITSQLLKSSGRSNYDMGYNILHIQCDNDFNPYNLYYEV